MVEVSGAYTHNRYLWPRTKVKVSESGIKWLKSMEPICMTGMKKSGWKVCVKCPALKFLLRKTAIHSAGWLAGHLDKNNSLHRSICHSYRWKNSSGETHMYAANRNTIWHPYWTFKEDGLLLSHGTKLSKRSAFNYKKDQMHLQKSSDTVCYKANHKLHAFLLSKL